MNRLWRYCLLLAAILVVNNSSFGDTAHCGLNQPEDKLKPCIQKVLDKAYKTQWEMQIWNEQFLRLPRQLKNDEFHNYSIYNVRVVRSSPLVVKDLTVQGVNTSHLSVHLSGFWRRLGVRMGLKGHKCVTTLLERLCTNITGYMHIRLRNATASLTATWQIADSDGALSIKQAGVEVTITVKDRNNEFEPTFYPRPTPSSGFLDKAHNEGEKDLRRYVRLALKKIYKRSMIETLKKNIQDESNREFIPHLTKTLGKNLVKMA